jgi:Tfp pilus assembly protein PilF
VVALGAATFLLFLVPVLLVPGSLVLDSRLVLPACAAALACSEIARALGLGHTIDRRLSAAFAGAAVVALAVVTLAYEGAFRDRRAFAREAVASSPASPLAHFCLGQSFQLDGDDDRALGEYRTALGLGRAEVVHNNVAVIDMSRGHWERAEEELRAELAINPRYAKAHGNLAIVLRHEARSDEACAAAQLAVRYDGEDEKWRQERERDCAANLGP